MKPDMLRRYAAEFIGTFALVFIGCGTRIMVGDVDNFAGMLVVHMAFACTVGAMIYSLSQLSAAHFNPAVTLGFALTRHFPWRYVLPYWIAQFGGAILASTLHFLLLSPRAALVHFGATIPKIAPLPALALEIVLTFFLMLVSMAMATDRRENRIMAGIAVTFTILVCGLFANSLSGGSMNPARSLAPALFTDGVILGQMWIYVVGPVIGAMLGSLFYELIRGDEQCAKGAPEELARSEHGKELAETR